MPSTGGQKTQLAHDWEDLSTAREVCVATGQCPSEERRYPFPSALDMLRAAFQLAVEDSLSPGWLRTPEQVDGGDFPGPWRTLHTPRDVMEFLIEYDASMQKSVSKSDLETKVKDMINALAIMSESVSNALLRESAILNNYTDLFNKWFTMPESKPLAVPRNQTIHCRYAERETTTPSSPESTLTLQARAKRKKFKRKKLPLHATLPSEVSNSVKIYKINQDVFINLLSRTEPAAKDKDLFLQQFTFGMESVIDCKDIYFACKIARRSPKFVYRSHPQMARALGTAIASRQKAHNWYCRLPHEDPRCESNSGHLQFLEQLRKAQAVLIGDTEDD